mgnify:FL=1
MFVKMGEKHFSLACFPTIGYDILLITVKAEKEPRRSVPAGEESPGQMRRKRFRKG